MMQVCHFYGYWQSYYTSKTYEWEDKFDLRDAPNRRVQRAMEKENKKVREAVKRERNETIRVGQYLLESTVYTRLHHFTAISIICEEEGQKNGSLQGLVYVNYYSI